VHLGAAQKRPINAPVHHYLIGFPLQAVKKRLDPPTQLVSLHQGTCPSHGRNGHAGHRCRRGLPPPAWVHSRDVTPREISVEKL